MIVRLANILRALLRDHDTFVPFRDELAFTDDYLGIEVVRFGADKLRVEREIEPETLEVMVPSMVLQPLIENSIKHGLEPRLEGGTVTLRSRVRDGRLVVDIEDDGVGIMPARAAAVGAVSAESGSGNGIGIKNVRERLEVLYGGEARFEVESRPGRGTRVTLEMPMLSLSDKGN
jgi:two-component system LytT family sensor kinase